MAVKVASYLAEKLGAEEIGYIEPFDFFYPAAVLVHGNVVELPQEDKLEEVPELPMSRFFVWRNPAKGDDLVIFLGEAQAVGKEREFANLVLDVAEALKVKRVYTAAAAIASISHSDKPRVWAAATSRELVRSLKRHEVVLRDKIHIRGLNGYLLGIAKERDMEGICLLGEIPAYVAQLGIEYPRSAQAVLEVLTRLLAISIDFSDIESSSHDVEGRLTESVQEIMQELGHLVIPSREAQEPEERRGPVPESVRGDIERLFEEVKQDRAKASKLKEELDRWGLFEEYEDRFLDLFRGGREED